MKRIFEWLKSAIEKRPITFVIVGGLLTYFLTCVVALVLFIALDRTGIAIVPFASAFIVVGFQWNDDQWGHTEPRISKSIFLRQNP